jgi:hypothetical protein
MNQFRALLCEMLLNLSLAVCPKGYSPSYVDATLIAYENGRCGLTVNGERIAPTNEEDAA